MTTRQTIFFILQFALFFKPLGIHNLSAKETDLIDDLLIVNEINKKQHDRFPVYYNNLLSGGYFNMPSARMGQEGELSFGYSQVFPYRNYNVRFQCLGRLEIYGNYRIFMGVDDPILSDTGFGEKSDKGVNVKFALLHPEDTHYVLPGIAIGYEDCIGTKGFESCYVALTQVIPKWNLECTLGYGKMRLRRWFGGVTWMPFRNLECPPLKHLALAAEYDATHYKSNKREPHPKGHSKRSPLNYGLKYRLWDVFDFTANYNKGESFAFSLATFYNFGLSQGFFPKIDNAPLYRAPKITEPLGPLRPSDLLVQDLIYPFNNQGFELKEARLSSDCYGQIQLRLKVCNFTWRFEEDMRSRLNELLANLIPTNISEVIVVLMNDELPLQEYRFLMQYVKMYRNNTICPYELFVITPPLDASKISDSTCIFKEQRDAWNVSFYPNTYTTFGSASGKFKWLLGLEMNICGYLPSGWYYSTTLGYTIDSRLYSVKDVDRLNPSQIINVRTDSVNYAKASPWTVNEAFLQKWWNLGRGWFGTLALGLFEPAYGGFSGECLYYPIDSRWAIGFEGAILKKRTYSGIGFTDHIRKLEGFRPTYQKFFGSQYFASLYYNFNALDIDLLFKAGKFLANDWGIRSELSRYYPSGIRVFAWYTYTDAKDYVNRKRYHDHGAGISFPLDIFYTRSSKDRFGYAMSAWLRDVGACADTGIPLYWQIRDNR